MSIEEAKELIERYRHLSIPEMTTTQRRLWILAHETLGDL